MGYCFRWPWTSRLTEEEKNLARQTKAKVTAQAEHVDQLHREIKKIVKRNHLGEKFSEAFKV